MVGSISVNEWLNACIRGLISASRRYLIQSAFTAGFLLLGCFWFSSSAVAQTAYEFSCPESTVKASIAYNMIGKYKAAFSSCQGMIVYDSQTKEFKSVEIKINAASIQSNCAWCDRVVKSRRLLETAIYPEFIFNSESFKVKNNVHWVAGLLTVHGVTRKLESSFEVIEATDRWLMMSGTWRIPRKQYKIIWSKVLDHGGIVVGDVVIVNWRVRAKRK